jgi:hypothetical protein
VKTVPAASPQENGRASCPDRAATANSSLVCPSRPTNCTSSTRIALHPLEGADEPTFERGGGAEAVREGLDDRLRRGTLTPAGDPTNVIWMGRRAAE